jgi:hypothetical protein
MARRRKTERKTEVFGEVKVYAGRHKADLMRMEDPDGHGVIVVQRVNDGSTLERWRKAGRISDAQYLAGKDYERDFYSARLNAKYTQQRLESVRGGQQDPEWLYRAKERFAAVCGALGALEGDVAWFVLGEGLSLRDYALRCRNAGRPMHRQTAGGLLLAALERLAVHYGHVQSIGQKGS